MASLIGLLRRERRDPGRADAETTADKLSPIRMHDPFEPEPSAFARHLRIHPMARRLPPHEVEAEEFTGAVAVVGEMSAPPKPSLRIIHGTVVPAFWTEHGGMALHKTAAAPARIETTESAAPADGRRSRWAKHLVKGPLIDADIVRLRQDIGEARNAPVRAAQSPMISKDCEMTGEHIVAGRDRVAACAQGRIVEGVDLSVDEIDIAVTEEAIAGDVARVDVPEGRPDIANLVRVRRIEVRAQALAHQNFVVVERKRHVIDVRGLVLGFAAVGALLLMLVLKDPPAQPLILGSTGAAKQ